MARASEWDESAWRRWVRDPDGPLRRDLLPRVGRDTAALAKARFHRVTGATADSIGWRDGIDAAGPYVQIGGSYVIVFLERPARQMHSPHRWLSDALREVMAKL